MTEPVPDPLVQAERAVTWLVCCPRDDSPLSLQADGTEQCDECGWHTGDPLVDPEERARVEADEHRRARLIQDVFYFAWGIMLIAIGSIWNQPMLLIIGAAFVGLPAFLHYDRRPRSGPPEPVTKGLIVGRGKAPKLPPPKGHKSRPLPPSGSGSLPAICSQCGGYADVHTSGWCGDCKTYASQRPKQDRALHPCAVCGIPTLSTSGECPSCEVHDGDWSYQQRRLDRQIVSSLAVPPVVMHERWPASVQARLHCAIPAAATTIPLDRRSPWREGTLVEVCIDPGSAMAESVLVRPLGTTLLVECRGYDNTVAVAHPAGAEIVTVRG